MTKTRLASAALALLLTAGLAAPSHAAETRGGGGPEAMKSPRKKDTTRDARTPAEQDTPATKPGGKIVYF